MIVGTASGYVIRVPASPRNSLVLENFKFWQKPWNKQQQNWKTSDGVINLKIREKINGKVHPR